MRLHRCLVRIYPSIKTVAAGNSSHADAITPRLLRDAQLAARALKKIANLRIVRAQFRNTRTDCYVELSAIERCDGLKRKGLADAFGDHDRIAGGGIVQNNA